VSVGDVLWVAVGRRPNVEDLSLKEAGVAFDEGGIDVDGTLRTSQPHVFAAGDCLGTHQFTHDAGRQAAVAVRNALCPLSSKGVRPHVPWTTFTDPEIAHAGLTEAQARDVGGGVETRSWPMSKVDRARAAGFLASIENGIIRPTIQRFHCPGGPGFPSHHPRHRCIPRKPRQGFGPTSGSAWVSSPSPAPRS